MGKDWHRPCLKCERCKKTLTPGGHAEVSEALLPLLTYPSLSLSIKENRTVTIHVTVPCLVLVDLVEVEQNHTSTNKV